MKLKRIFDDHGEWCYHVPSSSSDDEYQCSLYGGWYRCTCMDFQTRRMKGRMGVPEDEKDNVCKHIKEVDKWRKSGNASA